MNFSATARSCRLQCRSPEGPNVPVYIVECRVSRLAITIMFWEVSPHNST